MAMTEKRVLEITFWRFGPFFRRIDGICQPKKSHPPAVTMTLSGEGARTSNSLKNNNFLAGFAQRNRSQSASENWVCGISRPILVRRTALRQRTGEAGLP